MDNSPCHLPVSQRTLGASGHLLPSFTEVLTLSHLPSQHRAVRQDGSTNYSTHLEPPLLLTVVLYITKITLAQPSLTASASKCTAHFCSQPHLRPSHRGGMERAAASSNSEQTAELRNEEHEAWEAAPTMSLTYEHQHQRP